MGTDPDAELAGRLATDGEGAFVELVETYQDRLYAFALAMSGDPCEAEEVAQDTFVRAHRALRGYPAERIRELHLSGWLHRIALNTQRNRLRRRRPPTVSLDGGGPTPDSSPGPERQAELGAALRELALLLASLPPAQRSAVVLRHVQGLSYAEAAQVSGQAEITLRSNVHRGLARLRRRAGWLSQVSA